MKVSVIGTGGVGLSYVAYLANRGHEVTLWSPSGKGTEFVSRGEQVIATGAFVGETLPRIAASAKEATLDANVIVLALRANGHRLVLDQIAPHLKSGHTVLISSQYSLGALYLSKLLAGRKIDVPIGALSTTVILAQRVVNAVEVHGVRERVDVASIPANAGKDVLDICEAVFGDRFTLRDDVLAIALSNLNPPVHMANCLCNLTRMERGESWDANQMITASVGRLIEGLDAERLAIAAAFGLKVRSVLEHFALSFQLPLATTLTEMAQTLHSRRSSMGPKIPDHRHLTEDLPFGIAPLIEIGKCADVPMPLHTAGLEILSALRGKDFKADNDMLPTFQLQKLQASRLHALVRDGWKQEGAA